jgi:serine/threonine protein kinase
MDLKQYGIHITLVKGMNLEPHLVRKNMQVGYYSKHRGMVVLPSGRYSVGSFLGQGSFATIYTITSEDNRGYTIKMINMRNVSFESVMRECVVHILLEKESASQKDGPYVPRFYEVAYDPYNNLMLLRTETIQDILYDRYKVSTAEENERIIPHTLVQIAGILDFFYKRLKFNHRDCKPNNVLYNYDPQTGRFVIKLIDFGYSCLCWNDVNIHAGDRFALKDTCYHSSRDLTQFLYATYTDRAILLTERLRSTIRKILTFPVEGKVCRMYDKCRAYGKPMETWSHTYRFLNNRRIHNSNAEPERLMRHMLVFLGIRDVAKHTIEDLPHCVPERVLNPYTRRCIRRNSKQGQTILRLSKRYTTPSPRTLKLHRNSKGIHGQV